MTRLLGAVAVVALAGCGLDKADGFRQAFPKSSTVAMNVPAAKGAPLSGSTSTRTDGLLGDASQFYAFTRGVTVTVNAGVGLVLDLVERIVQHPATSTTQTTAVWGPYTDALSPNTYRFTATRNAQNDFSYALEAKGKNDPDSGYKTILSGAHVSTGQDLGNGSFLLDWDLAATLPEHGNNVGTAQVTYSPNTAADDVQIAVDFTNVKDDATGRLINATYRFTQHPGNGGSFDFTFNKDLVGGPATEAMTVRSRWQQTGAGRSDVKASGGDLGATAATASECWDSNFASRYLSESWDANAGWGQATDCSFATAEYSRL